jgi:Fic family protein
VPNANILLSPLATKEAVLSSKIEGTITTVKEVLEFEARGSTPEEPGTGPKADDIHEVMNYRRAISRAVERLNDLPISGRLLREAHAILLHNVRGQNKRPGEYRVDQNWIGSLGLPIEAAKFISIPTNQLADGISGWEKFLHSGHPDRLVQLAIIHVEFEALHPFQDGNGRLGRMIIPLFLFERKILSSPTFYISEYLEAHREEYYERLLAVSRDDDWTGWCVFFLKAISEQGLANTRKTQAIIDLYNAKKVWVAEQTRSRYAIHALDFIFKKPIFSASEFTKQAGIPEPTAKRIISTLKENKMLGIVRESAGRRSSLLMFTELLKIVAF